MAAGVVAALLAPAVVVLAQPAPPTATLPPIRSAPGQQAGDAGAPRTPDAGAPAVSPASTASASVPAGPAAGSATASPGAPPPPPPGYGYPPPGYGYPPPGYGYPPPGYGYPPPASPREQPHKLKRPPHDAAQASPFVDALAGVVVESNRFVDPLAVGGEAGLFVAGRLRISARFLLLPTNADDSNSWSSNSGYERQSSKSPSFVWGGTVGFAVVSRPSFLLSPGLLFMRANVGDYGSVLALDVPFEWVRTSGLRMGFDIALGRAFGGTFIERCYTYGYSASNVCMQGTTREIDRDPGATFYATYEIGWGWHH